ncbi:DUF1737 domain-containing protein [soil metagenome]
MLAYRLLTGEDTPDFCHKVTAALARGWQLYGNPSYAPDPHTGTMRCAQAVVKEIDAAYDPALKLGEM